MEADRGANGYREYDKNAVLRVRQIRHPLGAGLSSEDIAHLLAARSARPRSWSAVPNCWRRRGHGCGGWTISWTGSPDPARLSPTTLNAAERMGGESYPPFDDAGLEPVSA
ncbi:MerR family transcriptional regulator [Nocardia asteroides]